jgi:gliding motility-associated-like protein
MNFLRLFSIISLAGLSKISYSQNCVEPTGVKSTSLSYIELPPSPTTTFNYRFFYKIIIDCSEDPNISYDPRVPNQFPGYYVPGVDSLHVVDPYSTINNPELPNGLMVSYVWQLDSVKKITGQIDPCVVLSQPPCYSIYYYHTDVNTPDGTKSFVASMVSCCRPFNSVNIEFFPEYWGSGCSGSTTTGPIGNGMVSFIVVPPLATSPINNSPVFTSNDTILSTCINNPFSYSIHASDPDNDSIAYHFGTPRTFSLKLVPAIGAHQEVLVTIYKTFPQVTFKQGYSEQYPAGPAVLLDPVTGLLTGKLTDTGTLDITVSAVEYRSGKLLDSVTQDLYIKAYDCNLLSKPKAILPDSINGCESFTLNFPNNSIPQYPDVNFNNTSVLWNFGDGDSSTVFKPVHTYADTGSYHVRLIVFPGLHCADTTNAIAVVYPFVNANFSYSDTCLANSTQFVNLSSSSSGIITGNEWQIFKDSIRLQDSYTHNDSFQFKTAPQTYLVMLTTRNDKGCSSSASMNISIENSPAPLAFHDTLLSIGTSLQLKVDDGNYDVGGTYNWWPIFGLSNPFIANPVLNSTEDATYRVTVENKFGCEMTDSFQVKYYKGPNIYVPNAFTPNGDGRNDVFKPTYIGISKLKYFKIFNRYGQLMFETDDPSKGWDGNIHGEPAVQGAYVWEVSGLDYQGKWEINNGSLLLIK